MKNLSNLAESRSYRPVEIRVTQLVDETLHVVGLQPRLVVDHVVVRGRHGALAYALAHDKKVVPDAERGEIRQILTTNKRKSRYTVFIDSGCQKG